MKNYDPKQIEAKWQKKWLETGFSRIDKDDTFKEKFYILDMFPYPSGTGLHMGHTESYTASDVLYRFKKMQGFNVLHPQGFDSFGLPAENFAIKTGVKPQETTKANMENYIRQMKSLGFAYDFSEQAVTSSPEYYKWTQWIFGEFFKNNLVYKKTSKTNWCPSCQTVLANEQVIDGRCDRCGTEVEQKEVPGWFFRITDFAEELIDGLDKVDWPEYTKKNQKNWIGKSEGAEFEFKVKDSQENVKVFTTRLDTVFGVTYVVVAPEHPLVAQLVSQIANRDEVLEYIEKSKNKTELDRMEAKEKSGVELQGIKAVNPFTQESVPVYVADYVLGNYGTGAVMAVPAHDERDFEFSKKYNLSLKKSIDSVKSYIVTIKSSLSDKFYEEVTKFALIVEIDGLMHIYTEEVDKVFDLAENFFVGDLWYIHSEGLIKKILFHTKNENKRFDWSSDEGNKLAYQYGLTAGVKEEQLDWKGAYEATPEDGILINSENYSGLSSREAREKMIQWLEKEGLGKKVVNYRLRDWSISRQRYWGCPIPIVYSPEGKAHLVPEEHLPWTLPEDVDFHPTGVSPLAKSVELKKRTEEIFGSGWTAEYDTMDTFVDSAWYFLRYPDPHNSEKFCGTDRLKKWLPVDLYIGGAEHTYMHLLFARFFTKAMHRIGILDFDEPFLKLRHQGMVLDKEGKKMSKSKGNVINPDDMVEKFSADAVRTYMLFAAPLEDAVMWNENNIVGVHRFLGKVWKLQGKISEQTGSNITGLLHKTIKKVTEDINELRFNTAISAMMILVNEAEKSDITKSSYNSLLQILSPFAPHIAEELWEKLGHEKSIFLSEWPQYDPEMIKDEMIQLVVQVNGKVRDTLEASVDISENDAKELAMQSEKVKNFTTGKEIKKVIFVPKKLINIVI
ncbi:MAG: class I tRNA ligase family protein [Parcubacteria group bacterium]|jgi:leucyl-tRNA synthetase